MKKIFFITLILFSFFANNIYANSITINGASISSTILSIAQNNNLNVIIDPKVEGNITTTLTNMSPKEMIKSIAKGNNLYYGEEDNIIYINKDHFIKNFYTLYVKYLDLEIVKHKVDAILNPKDKKEENKVILDPFNSTISFYATKPQYEKIQMLLNKDDKKPKQVSLEAKIISIENNKSKDLGIQWSWSNIPSTHNLSDTNKNDKEKRENPFGTAIRFGKNINSLGYEIGIGAKLNALISKGYAKVLARPNIVTIQGKEAIINIGGEVPVTTTTISDNTTTTSVEYRPAGIILRYTPRVNDEGDITVDVHTEVSTPAYVEDLKAYRFQKRSADTLVRLKNGETMVIGGLISKDEMDNMSKVPFLSDIPILGNLFKYSQKGNRTTELMIFLTAKEVD